jgi:hypothetical protein
MSSRVSVAALMLATCGLIVLAVWFYPSRTDFRPVNPFWNGLNRVAEDWQMVPLASLDRLPRDPAGTVLVVIPYRPVNAADASRVRRYVDGGGLAVILDDYGFGTPLLRGMGLPLRFAGEALLDPLFRHRNRWMPEATAPAEARRNAEARAVVLNHATALVGVEAVSVILRSSPYSFLDRNGNGEWEPDEPRGPFAVAAHTKVGSGAVAVVSDPSVLINSMIDLGANRSFVRRILQLAGERPRVYLDEAHLPARGLDESRAQLRSVRDFVAEPIPLIGLVVAIVIAPLVMMLKDRRNRHARPG